MSPERCGPLLGRSAEASLCKIAQVRNTRQLLDTHDPPPPARALAENGAERRRRRRRKGQKGKNICGCWEPLSGQ